MKFRTDIEINPITPQIEHNQSILTIGSCFAENIGDYFSKLKFDTLVNPFGVLYNSASINSSIELALAAKPFTAVELIFDQGEWHSFYHHSNFSHHEPGIVLEKINVSAKHVREFLEKVDWVVLSLGTSFVYQHKERNIIVSNCHKLPQKEFEKIFLSVDQNTVYLSNLITLIRELNPNSKFIFTVSPIRHWKDGAHENQLSKGSLHLSIQNVLEIFKGAYYFPSYEILIDELRDYRFYAKDMIHPSSEAIEYIWEKFSENVLSKSCLKLVQEIDKIVQASQHRIRNVNSPASKQFASKNISQIEKLVKEYPYLNFETELNRFSEYNNQ